MITLIKGAQPYLDCIMNEIDLDFLGCHVNSCFISLYTVTRHYGGREEGGWWYDWHSLEETRHVPYTDKRSYRRVVKALVEDLINSHGLGHGDIYSVNGGEAVDIYLEEVPGENQTKNRPRYE